MSTIFESTLPSYIENPICYAMHPGITWLYYKIVLVAIYFGTLPKNPMFRFSLNLLNIPYGGWVGVFCGWITKFVSYNEWTL